MKKLNLFISSIIMLLIFVGLLSCNQPNNTVLNNDKEDSVVVDVPSKKGINKAYIQAMNSSVLEFTCEIHSKRKVEAFCGHCCLYSNDKNFSYLALPKHCFPYDPKKQYKLSVKDFRGKVTELSWKKLASSSQDDAEILKVPKLEGLSTLCERGMITNTLVPGDSAVLLVPFNKRNVHKKYGIIVDNTTADMNPLASEPGDSGGLIISKDGVIGIEVAYDGNNKFTSIFVPIKIFEELCLSITEEK